MAFTLPPLSLHGAVQTTGPVNQQNNLGSGSQTGTFPFNDGPSEMWKYAAIGLLLLGGFYMWKRHRS